MRRTDSAALPVESQYHQSCLLHPEYQKQEILMSTSVDSTTKTLTYPMRNIPYDSSAQRQTVVKPMTLSRLKQGQPFECTRVTCPHVPNTPNFVNLDVNFVHTDRDLYTDAYLNPSKDATHLPYAYGDGELCNSQNSFTMQPRTTQIMY